MSSAQGRAAQGERDYPVGYAMESPEAQYASGRSGGGGAVAGSVLAGVLMIIAGITGFLSGLAKVIKGGYFTYSSNYAYHWSTKGWGWTELIVGAVVFAAGVCVILGMVWARMLGVVLATLSAVASFLTIPFYPFWSIIVIALDVFIIWALVARRRHA